MINMRDMLKAGVHFGHAARFWCPKMEPYIYGSRDKIHIINLVQTQELYTAAINFVGKVAASGGKVLFVATKSAAQKIVQEEAQRCGMPYVDHRWLGGMLTNYKTVRQSIKRLRELEKMRDEGVFERMIKKEALQMSRQLSKLERSLGGIKEMSGLPEALFIIDVGYEKIAVKEANRLKIPVVGVVDTNNDPAGVDYIIPGNDDSMAAIRLYLNGAAEAINAAKQAAGVMAKTAGDKEDKPKQEVAQEVKQDATSTEEMPAEDSTAEAVPKTQDEKIPHADGEENISTTDK